MLQWTPVCFGISGKPCICCEHWLRNKYYMEWDRTVAVLPPAIDVGRDWDQSYIVWLKIGLLCYISESMTNSNYLNLTDPFSRRKLSVNHPAEKRGQCTLVTISLPVSSTQVLIVSHPRHDVTCEELLTSHVSLLLLECAQPDAILAYYNLFVKYWNDSKK